MPKPDPVVLFGLFQNWMHILGLQHLTQKDLSCQICPATFKDIPSLNTHYEDQHSAPKAKQQPLVFCRICAKEYQNKRNLRAHEFTAHGIGQAPRKCRFCDQRFGHTNSLKAHMKRDHPEHASKTRKESSNILLLSNAVEDD